MVLLASCASVSHAAGWKRLYVVDERLAVLRAAPGLTASVLKRLRVGRAVYEVGRRRDEEGRSWLRVAVTRRTRGWMLADALASPGDRDGERRLGALIAGREGFDRLEVARLAVDRFPRLRAGARAAIEAEATLAIDGLTERATGRLGPLEGLAPGDVRALMLSDPALDRYNRLGVFFDADPITRRYFPGGKRREE